MSILLVEDNPMDAELTLRTLRRLGLAEETRVVGDGKEASDLLFGPEGESAPELPRLLLLDLKLPKVTGLQLLQWIRANPRTQHLPVAILTGLESDRDVVELYRLGVSGYFTKPLEAKEFAALADRLALPRRAPGATAPARGEPTS